MRRSRSLYEKVEFYSLMLDYNTSTTYMAKYYYYILDLIQNIA